MKALLINPIDRTITEVEYDGNYKTIYTLIGADNFDLAGLNNEGDGIFVDGEGLLKDDMDPPFRVAHPDLVEPCFLVGKGLVLGTDKDGESITPHITLAELKDVITFPTPLEAVLGRPGARAAA